MEIVWVPVVDIIFTLSLSFMVVMTMSIFSFCDSMRSYQTTITTLTGILYTEIYLNYKRKLQVWQQFYTQQHYTQQPQRRPRQGELGPLNRNCDGIPNPNSLGFGVYVFYRNDNQFTKPGSLWRMDRVRMFRKLTEAVTWSFAMISRVTVATLVRWLPVL